MRACFRGSTPTSSSRLRMDLSALDPEVALRPDAFKKRVRRVEGEELGRGRHKLGRLRAYGDDPPSSMMTPSGRFRTLPDTGARRSMRGSMAEELTEQLRQLRIRAGDPSIRELRGIIQRQAPAFVMSRSTIHEKLSGKSLPNMWQALALIRACATYAKSIGVPLTADDMDEQIWRDRVEAARALARSGRPEPSSEATEMLYEHPEGTRPPTDNAASAPNRGHSLIWSPEIPFRNPHFIGHEASLEQLRTQLITGTNGHAGQSPAILHGLGGIGKTELAAEYAYRFRGDYDLVWWIRAEQQDLIRSALVYLGRRLALPDVRPEERDYSFRLVLEALQAGNPYEHWLLIFDNVTNPGIVGRYIPQGHGNVIVTSRISEWQRELRTSGIEITEFALAETVQSLRKRIPRLAYRRDTSSTREEEEAQRQADAERLAQTVGNLPLAAEHAAAYLAETGEPIDEYIAAFERNAHELLSREADMYSTHVAVSTTWSTARNSLTPEAGASF
jgi:hypothetical protein